MAARDRMQNEINAGSMADIAFLFQNINATSWN